MPKHICIIGNGIAGITAARHIRKLSDYKITVISAESKYFYSRTALMYVYMGHMKLEHTKPYEDWFWEKNRIELLYDYVENIDFQKNEIHLKASNTISYDELVIATGSKPNMFGWPGQHLNAVQGLYSIQDLEKMESATKNVKSAVIVGGGLIGVEMAEMLISRKIKVTILARESNFWDNVLPIEEAQLIEREIIKHGVDLRLNTEILEIIGDANGKVTAVKTKQEETIEAQFVGLTIGVSPNIGFLENTDLEMNRGILVDENLKTNIQNVYAIGDCVEHKSPPAGRRNIEQIWYTGKIMGETLAKTLTGNVSKYEPGIFYNSAKFFDIEYSVYGNVNPVKINGIDTFYWENIEGNKCLRINYDSKTEQIVGIHAFGIRLRAKTCLDWIENKTNFKTVLSDIEKANFEPEFSKNYLIDLKKSHRDDQHNNNGL